MVNFDQTQARSARQIYRDRRIVFGEDHGKVKERQAQGLRTLRRALLTMTGTKSHRDDRAILREMTAEWLRLADAIVHPLKPIKSPLHEGAQGPR
jgi:hypothetical protein